MVKSLKVSLYKKNDNRKKQNNEKKHIILILIHLSLHQEESLIILKIIKLNKV